MSTVFFIVDLGRYYLLKRFKSKAVTQFKLKSQQLNKKRNIYINVEFRNIWGCLNMKFNEDMFKEGNEIKNKDLLSIEECKKYIGDILIEWKKYYEIFTKENIEFVLKSYEDLKQYLTNELDFKLLEDNKDVSRYGFSKKEIKLDITVIKERNKLMYYFEIYSYMKNKKDKSICGSFENTYIKMISFNKEHDVLYSGDYGVSIMMPNADNKDLKVLYINESKRWTQMEWNEKLEELKEQYDNHIKPRKQQGVLIMVDGKKYNSLADVVKEFILKFEL